MYELLIEAILTLGAAKEYSSVLRSFLFLLSWLRVQGLLYYLKSYSLSKHIRQSIIVPTLLRCWLRLKHIRQYFLSVLQGNSISNPISYVILQFVVVARSNSILISNTVSKTDYNNIYLIIQGYRTNLQQMLQALAQSINADKRRLSRPTSRAGTLVVPRASATTITEPSLAELLSSSREAIPIAQPALIGRQQSIEQGKKADSYLRSIKKPNMHIAIYYQALAEEYGLLVNFNVTIGEDKHRAFKKQIYITNYRNLEKDLLTKESLRQTLRFILNNAYRHDEPLATTLIKDVSLQCPTLFYSILPKLEQISLDGSILNNDDDEDKIGVVSNNYY